jgi:Asp-tRNA(Asn)/Glu-tRNA(Gln) amidotransferase A subunit family amidase
VSAIQLANAFLARIAEVEPDIRAFANLDRDLVFVQAGAADLQRAAGVRLGPLHGLPVAVKDIIDTFDLPTELGTPLHRGRRPSADALIVQRLRAAGAIVLGKTVTTEYAFYAPGPTRNPHNRERSPGGSSSGSAAAVAAKMAPLAIGTQTNGSIIRPASFCGVVGYKPSLGLLPRTGILKHSPLLDQPGVMATNVADAALLTEALAGLDPNDEYSWVASSARLVDAATQNAAPPRLACMRGPSWERADPDARKVFDTFIDELANAVTTIAVPPEMEQSAKVHQTIMEADIAKSLRDDYERGRAEMSGILRGMIERGLATSAGAYADAAARREQLIDGFMPLLDGFDGLVTLSATGSAPMASDGTGDPIMATAWTLLGAPAISLPLLTAANGMPIGVQVVGRPREDGRLLASAAWLEAHWRSRTEEAA